MSSKEIFDASLMMSPALRIRGASTPVGVLNCVWNGVGRADGAVVKAGVEALSDSS